MAWKWYTITAILCAYGFFKEFRPLEPFLAPYLETKNFTLETQAFQIYPFWTYGYLVVLIPTFLLTDLLRYKPVILFESLTYAATWALLIWTGTVASMQLMQVFYGCATATEVAYYSYIFAAVDESHYKKVTSYSKAAVQLGRFFAYGLSQLIISLHLGDYKTLNYISMASCCLILLLAWCLPWISYKHKAGGRKRVAALNTVETPESYRHFVRLYFRTIWQNFRHIYSNAATFKWSLWLALAMCGFLQVGNYIQTLWNAVQMAEGEDVLNGVVEAINTCISALVIVGVQFVNVRWDIWGELSLAIASMVNCALLIVMSQSSSIYLIYAFYILVCAIYQVMCTVAMFNIAKRLITESYGLAFGFNTFMALVFQTILTFAVADEHGFHLKIRSQFIVYGCFYAAIGLLFLITGIRTLYKSLRFNRTVEPEVNYAF